MTVVFHWEKDSVFRAKNRKVFFSSRWERGESASD